MKNTISKADFGSNNTNNNNLTAFTGGIEPPSATQEQLQFLKTLFDRCTDGYIEFRPLSRTFRPSMDERKWVSVKKIHVPQLPDKKNIYVGVATRHEGKGTKADIIEIPAVWVDVDFKRTPEEEAHKRLDALEVKPSIHVHSGGGWHLYWVLEKPATFEDMPKIEEINLRLAEYFGGDTVATDASRILRLPDTENIKYTPPLPVRLLSSDRSKLYQIDNFAFLPAQSQIAPPSTDIGTASIFKGVIEGHRHDRTRDISKYLFKKGLTLEDALDIGRLWNEENQPPHTAEELQSTIRDIYMRYHQKKRDSYPA